MLCVEFTMLRRLLAISLVTVAVSNCSTTSSFYDPFRNRVKNAAVNAIMECPSPMLIAGEPDISSSPARVAVEGCNRRWDCLYYSGSMYSKTEARTECKEASASRAAVKRSVVVDRLSLETGCPVKKIKVIQKSAWSSGGERAYRLEACGKYFVCTAAPGRTDCKPAVQ